MRKQLYLALKEQLKGIKINGQEVIKHIGLWNRQVEFIEEETPFEMPAIFIEFGKIAWRHQNGGVQDAMLTVAMHVITAAVPEGYDGDLFHLELLDNINKALHGFTTDYTNSMARVSSLPCHDHSEILDSTEVFTCQIYDDSAVKEHVKIRPKADVAIGQKV